MLDLTRSRTRAAMLAVLFADVEREWHIRGLAREIGASAGNVRRELTRLAADGYVTSRRQANLVLFRLDQGHPLYPELRGVVSKTVGAEGQLARALVAVAGVRIAFIFGSLAVHRENPGSDIDLMVVGTPAARALHAALRPAEESLRRDVHYFVFAADELATRVREHDGFIGDVLAGPRAFVVGDEIGLQQIVAGETGAA
jgi:predicted nucleotidyltransferase